MAKKSETVKGMVEKAIIDSFRESKEENGLQIFVRINPHVSSVEFSVYSNGWSICAEADLCFYIYTDGDLAPSPEQCKEMLKPIYDLINKTNNNGKRF